MGNRSKAAGWAVVLGTLAATGVGAQTGAVRSAPAATGAKPMPARRLPTVRKPVINPRLPKETQAQQLAFYAEDLQGVGNYAEAAKVLQQAAELTPEDWDLWEKTGWGHLDAGQAAPALKAFEAARNAAPQGAGLSGGLLIAHFALGNQKELLELVRQMAAPETVDQAVAILSRGMAARPQTLDWNFALGYLYVRVLGNRSRALDPLEAVIAADPKRADAWLYLVEVNQELNRGRQEDAAAVTYLELAPETPDAYRLRAQRFVVLNRVPDAVAEYQAGIAKHPTAGELYYELARTYERTGGVKEAEGTYNRLITLADTRKLPVLHTQARAQLANFHARQRNYPAAEAYFREAAQRPDASAQTWNTWGSLLVLSGKWPEAAKAMTEAADRAEKVRGKTHPQAREDLLQARYRAGLAWLAAAQREPAKAALLAARELKGTARTSPEMEATALLAWVEGPSAKAPELAYQKSDERWAGFVWRKEGEEVAGEVEIRGKYSVSATAWRALLQQVQKVHRDCWPASYALARVYASAGFSEEALDLLTDVTQSRNDWWAPYYAMGQYYAQRRNKDEGVSPLRKVLQLAPECRQARSMLALLNAVQDEDQ